ncbi:CREB-binding protein, partial [Araneus ventricosus]
FKLLKEIQKTPEEDLGSELISLSSERLDAQTWCLDFLSLDLVSSKEDDRSWVTINTDFDLYVNSFDKGGHNIKTEELGSGLDDSSTCDQKQTNPQESRRLTIQHCLQSLEHVCQCKDFNCRLPSCQNMKMAVEHAESCKWKTNGGCFFYVQLVALSGHHTKHCQVRAF